MPQRTDLYSVLYSYSRKNESPHIKVEEFIAFLSKYAAKVSDERPEWKHWTADTSPQVWRELNQLVENGKVLVVDDDTGPRIFMLLYYAEQVMEAYKNPDNDADMPFPDEKFLNIKIPGEQLKPLDVGTDLPDFLKDPQETSLPIIKLVFPDNQGEGLFIASMIPLKMLEFCMLKIRNFLLHRGNKEYILRKLAPQMTGKEDYLREIVEQIMIHPLNCVNDLKEGREVAFFFWTFFCNLVKQDLSKKKELLTEEIGALQAIYLVEVCSGFFKARAARAKTIELAFKNFELELEKPPYYFSREAIAKFKDNKGIPLLGQYSQDGLDAYIKKRISESAVPNELPELMYFHTEDGANWLIKKTKLMPLCARLFVETRPVVIKAVSKRWKKLLKDYLRESAMDDDREFEKLLTRYVEEYAPVLAALLKDHRLFLVHDEISRSEKGMPAASRLLNKNELLPMRVLLMIKRKELLSDVKLLMPFWYSIPILNAIIAFFHGLGQRKKEKQKLEEEKATSSSVDDVRKALQNVSKEAEANLVPDGYTLDTYLKELTLRWGRLINKQAQENLVEDVNALVRDKLRHLLRFQKTSSINRDTLDKLTNAIMDSSPNLAKVGEQNSLFMYIKLYLVKLLIGKAAF
jgi:hypothetical protein